MAKGQFESVLDRPSSSFEAPKPLPTGVYHVMVQGQYREDKSSRKQTPFVEFTLKVISPVEGVDKKDLDAYLSRKGGEDRKLQDVTLRYTFYTTEEAMIRLVRFLDILEAGEEDESLRQRLAETPNKECIVRVVHQPSDDGESMYAVIKSAAKAA